MPSTVRFSEETIERVRKFFLNNPYVANSVAAKGLGLSPACIGRVRRELEEQKQIEQRPDTSLQADRSGKYRRRK